MSLSSEIIQAIEKSWNQETCYPADKKNWSKENPSIGQCAITALFIQELLGGKIIYNEPLNHYWNLLDNELEIDLTRNQFKEITFIDTYNTIEADNLLSSPGAIRAKTKERLDLFKINFLKNINS